MLVFSSLNFEYLIGTSLLLFILLIFILNFKFIIKFINFVIQKLNIKNIYLTKKSNNTITENSFTFFLIDTSVWLMIFLQIFYISKGLGLNLSYTEISYIFGLSIIIGIIPISFGGFGVRDIFIFEALNKFIEPDDILILLVFFNLRYFIPGIIGYIIKISEYNNR